MDPELLGAAFERTEYEEDSDDDGLAETLTRRFLDPVHDYGTHVS